MDIILTMAVLVLQAAPEVPLQLVDLIDTLMRLVAISFLVIPVSEVRRLLGGLPDIPLPGGEVIKAGRWFSWLVGAGLVAFGHFVGWLTPPDFADFQAWFALEVAILSGVANIIYSRFWRGEVGMPEDET